MIGWFQLHNLLEKAKLWTSKKMSNFQWLGNRKGWLGSAQRIFRTVKMCCMAILWCIYVVIYLFQFIECITLRVQEWTLMPTMDFRWKRCVNTGSEIVINVPLWCDMLTMGESKYVWGHVVYGKLLYLPFNFVVNLKLL